ncbi:hypothetical protein [Hymenobacter rubidus]|uniref:hypothetical protein n=1 Tax=Hymenobacter rubidus TaxID=1441626 RepID=UPI00191EE2B5|nr:hypothetical protein [Hymenobacter rubidus]
MLKFVAGPMLVCLLAAARPEPVRAQAGPPAKADSSARAYTDVGNGDRLFVVPTARNLRRGEGYAQDLELVVVGASYGLTNSFSLGAFVSVIPGQGTDNIALLTPKVSFPVAKKLRAGIGSFLIASRSGSGAITYANATYGTADANLTLGVGYGATRRSGFINTPLVLLGGTKRVSRLVSLLNETYLIYDRAFLDLGTFKLVAGIAGVRVAGPRFGGGLGLLYAFGQLQDSDYFNGSARYFLPVGEFTVRFGKIK